MSEPKLEITTGGRTILTPLRPGLTRIGPTGGRGVHIEIEGATGELHVWDEPPKVVRVQGDDALIVDGEMVEEAELTGGTVFAWSGAKFRYELPAVASGGGSVLTEISAEPAQSRGPAAVGGASQAAFQDAGNTLGDDEYRAWRRISAGLVVVVGLADKKATSRWQAAVVRHEWDADAASRDILAGSPGATSDPAFVERAGRLERDLLMTSYQTGVKGLTRRARGAARSTSAFLLANVIAIGCYSAILLALAILARVKYDWSFDGIIDRMVDTVTPGLVNTHQHMLPELFPSAEGAAAHR